MKIGQRMQRNSVALHNAQKLHAADVAFMQHLYFLTKKSGDKD
jgi:hypothetical protein